MKKIFAIMGMAAAAALAFTSCQKEAPETPENIIEEPATGAVPFVIHVNAETKTTNDGLHTNWAAGDQLSVFHEDVDAEGTYYPTDQTADQFTITDLSTNNTFTGTLGTALQDGKTYNWYAIYPYDSHIKTPANTNTGYLTIGSAANGAQTQTGNNSMGHIAGKNYPLAGKATSVPYGSVPSITMTHVSSLVEITVTNSLAEDLTVTSIDFTSAAEDIVGTYYINFAGATPTFTKSGSDYVSSTATLNVNSGAAIATSDSAKFYLAVKPFTATAGSNILTVTVHGTTASGSGTQVKNITSGSDVVFHPGKIKKVAVNYNTAVTPSLSEPTEKTGWYRVENASWLRDGDRVAIVASEADYALSGAVKDNNRSHVAITKGSDRDYATMTSNSNVQEFILENGAVSGTFSFWQDNGSYPNQYIYAASSSNNYLKSKTTKDADGSFDISVNGSGEAAIIAQGDNTRNIIRYNNLFACYASGQNPVAIYKYYGGGTPTCATPEITVSGASVSITSTGGAAIYYTTDGSEPTAESTLYAGSFGIAASTTVKAIAIRAHYNNSAVASQVCVPTCATPVITPLGTSFSIYCATEGATIYYETSTVGEASVPTPTTSSSVYSSAIAIAATTYVKAYAVKSGYNDSEIASEVCSYSKSAIETTVSVETYASDNSWENGTKYTSMTIDSNVNATVSGGGNSGKYYTAGNQWRLYQNESATITIDAGLNTIEQVSITYAVANTGTLLDASANIVESESLVNVNANSVTFTVGNTASATNGQVRITSIYVKYTPN